MQTIIGILAIVTLAISFVGVVAIFFWPIVKLLFIVLIAGITLTAISKAVNSERE